MAKYHTLLINEGNRWEIAFGDYDKDTVLDEKDEYWHLPARQLKVITTGDTQGDIAAKVKQLNS